MAEEEAVRRERAARSLAIEKAYVHDVYEQARHTNCRFLPLSFGSSLLSAFLNWTHLPSADLEARVGLAVQSVAQSEAVPAGSRARIHRL